MTNANTCPKMPYANNLSLAEVKLVAESVKAVRMKSICAEKRNESVTN